ncbi:conserved hypothetical protein [Pseudomonas sp. 8AS]|uniref:hypothetical protein n=1 Tax=Pseudomonas sp. 8AS TaxID=2653163 RepID=UPI0012F2CF42|nr:hypothetical protein [Pseudomonas sp. 8AS]VXA92874.1 conserved hypothetical protein [Pseudomonas sp. 8AS]
MSEKVMMYYGPWSEEEIRFDASHWFSSGMYRPRHMGERNIRSATTMLRNQPKVFTAQDNDELCIDAIMALNSDYPAVDSSLLSETTPDDLYRRVRYVFSAFDEPARPVDSYQLYLKLNGERYIITFAIDAHTGEHLATGSYADKFDPEQPAFAEAKRIFAELDDQD